MELDEIIDSLEECDGKLTEPERWALVKFLYSIHEKYGFEERENNIEVVI